jgi:putative DNA primase/helicase
MQLFSGYVRTKDKKCLDKFKDAPLRTLEDVQGLDEYAGILADGVILIDFDDQAQAEIMMHIVEDLQLDCRVYQTTRGRHFLFKNKNHGVNKNGTKQKLACGLTADIKVGGRNAYEVLEFAGEERFIEWDIEPGGEYQELPKWLYPVKSRTNFLEMQPGDGRNNALYSYILTLTAAGFSKEESRECLRLINDYILEEPLSEDELETILRDEAFPKDTFFEKNRFSHDAFATFIKNNDHIRKINGQLHVYRGGAYVPGAREIESLMIQHLPMLKAAQRTEVLKYLDIITEAGTVADAKFIAFQNGIYDLTTGELSDFSPDIVITNKIPWEYDSGAYSELADKTLNKLACGDKKIRALLEECIGYCFYRRNELSKAFILTGDKSNGKSTFLDMVRNVLGDENCSSLDLGELDERFSVATLGGRLANIGDDISDEFLQGKSVAMFKKIVSGNEVKAEIKNDPNIFFMRPYVKLLFSANDIPRMKDKTGAVLRRLVIVPFNAKFSKNDPDYDPYIIWKLREPEVMKYLCRIGVEGLQRVIKNNGFTTSEKVEKEIQDYEISNNPILLFLQDWDITKIENQPTKDIHKAYRVFCIENGFSEMTLANFSKELGRRLGLTVARKRVNGRLIGVYVRG